jgi:transcriptional regulator with XRE-family HTH domain
MDVIAAIRRSAKEAGTQKALAERLGISESYLADVLGGRKDPGEAILEPLGLERVVTYRRKRQNGSRLSAQ